MNADLVQSLYVDSRSKLTQAMKEMKFTFDIETLCNIRKNCAQADLEKRKRNRRNPVHPLPPLSMIMCAAQPPLTQTPLQTLPQLVPIQIDAPLQTKSIQVLHIEQLQEQPTPSFSQQECNRLGVGPSTTLPAMREFADDINHIASMLSEDETFFGPSATLLANAINDSGMGDDQLTLDDDGYLHTTVSKVEHATTSGTAAVSNDRDMLNIPNDCEVYFFSSELDTFQIGAENNTGHNLMELDDQVGNFLVFPFSEHV